MARNKTASTSWILWGMAVGVAYGAVCVAAGATDHIDSYVRPVGQLFLRLLKMIAVPLVLFSLAAGVASLRDTAKLGRIGGKTVLLYVCTTAVAITIGLIAAAIFGPGKGLSQAAREQLGAEFGSRVQGIVERAGDVSMIDQLLAIVPTNPFEALAQGDMLAVVFFSLVLGVAFTRLPSERARPTVQVFEVMTEAVIEMVHLIMRIAPFGVFALLATLIADLGEDSAHIGEVLRELLLYMLAVLVGLAAHLFLVYGLLIRVLARRRLLPFLRALAPAQLLAFSSSSSAATLPVTIECVREKVGVEDEVASFVLPLGATINMDGTALYQGVAAVFIANVYMGGVDLTQQLQIVLTATLASIGTAAVPGVGIIMLTIVLKQIGVPTDGIALILGVDRLLDMCRTVVNVTGDATVATVVATTEGAIAPPPA